MSYPWKIMLLQSSCSMVSRTSSESVVIPTLLKYNPSSIVVKKLSMLTKGVLSMKPKQESRAQG